MKLILGIFLLVSVGLAQTIDTVKVKQDLELIKKDFLIIQKDYVKTDSLQIKRLGIMEYLQLKYEEKAKAIKPKVVK